MYSECQQRIIISHDCIIILAWVIRLISRRQSVLIPQHYRKWCASVCWWFSFVFPAQHLQRTPAAGGTGPDGGWANASLQACQQKLRLQSLQLERERLKQRQQEIRLQVLIRKIRQSCYLLSIHKLRSYKKPRSDSDIQMQLIFVCNSICSFFSLK